MKKSNVFRLSEFRDKETHAILRALLSRSMQDADLTGLALCFRTADGKENTVFTGVYKAHPEDAAAVALRLSVRLLQR